LFIFASRSAKRRVGAFDVEENKIENREKRIVGTIAQKARRFDGRVQAHLFGAGQNSLCKGKLHHGLAARNGESAVKGTDRRGKRSETVKHLLRRNVGAVLKMPRIGIVAIRATQQAT
jgi:hypothetical protein